VLRLWLCVGLRAALCAEPQTQINTKWLDINPADMELQAVVNNPDMRESLYNARVARDEAKKAITKMFPGVSFSYGTKGTNDEYIVNQHWNEAGAQISFNLLGILSAPTATSVRLHWTDQPYIWHVNDGQEVFAVMDGVVDMHYRVDDIEKIVTLEAGDLFYANVGCEHVAHPRVASRILVVEKEGSV
jgi:mannose-6-phosphate isomerase-like protein (cupin superfamily)